MKDLRFQGFNSPYFLALGQNTPAARWVNIEREATLVAGLVDAQAVEEVMAGQPTPP